MKSLLPVLVLTFASNALAQVDASGSIQLESNFIPPGSIVKAVFSFRNNGPGVDTFVGAGSSYVFTAGFRTLAVGAIAETPPCRVRYLDFALPPPQLSSYGVSISPLRDLQPGESTSCTVGITTFPESPTVFTHRFGFGAIGSDLNPADNTVTIQIRTRFVETIPATSYFGKSVLALGLLGFALMALRRPG
jgi:hypothetical protein